MINFVIRVVIAKILSFATSLLRAHILFKNLSFMLVHGELLIFMISMVLSLDGLKDFHGYMFLWPFKICWYYVVLSHNYARFNYDYLLKPHIIQQSRKPTFEEMASS